MWPKVSIIWLNYNSSRFMSIVLRSLESVAELDYPPDKYELIVVDNGSTDGSYEKIKGFLEKKSSLRKKVIRLTRNLGFTGGNNVGFAARDKESKYVLLLNNDAVLFQRGLKTLVEYAENDDRVAGLQGVVLRYGTRLIDTAGDFVDEMLHTYVLGSGREYPWTLHRPIYVSYTDGACTLYRVEHILRCLGNKLFIDEFFAYGDDSVLGLMLWNHGYRLVAMPEAIAEHVRTLTFGTRSLLPIYLSTRSRSALTLITNTRYRDLIWLHILRNSLTSTRLEMKLAKYLLRALIDGIELGNKLKSKGFFIDIYKAPLVRIPLGYIEAFFAARRVASKYFDNWDIKILSSLVVE